MTLVSRALARIAGEEARGALVLPALREETRILTADGLRLVGELALPSHSAPVATVVMMHPNPTAGGSMDSHIIRKAAGRLPEQAGLAVLRFNTRGTASAQGRSEGAYDASDEERHDAAAAVSFAKARGLPRIWLVGWSFGSELAVRHGRLDPVCGIILLSPPLRRCSDDELAAWGVDGRAVVAVVPEHDDYLRPPEALRRFAVVPQAQVIDVAGARHLWVGESATRRVLSEIVTAVLAPSAPPIERADEPACGVSADSDEESAPADR